MTSPIKGRILFVDDEENMRSMMQIILEKDGHKVALADNGEEALELFRNNRYDLVIQDITMPEMDGMELLGLIKEADARIPVVVITAHSTWERAVEAMRLGAYDYLKKPFDNTELRELIARILLQRQRFENMPDEWSPDLYNLIGSSALLKEIFDLIKRVAPTDSTVTVQGESGVGKEMVARIIHMHSLRANQPLIAVNCGAFSETLLESELFGHKKGAFTGAVSDKKGLLDLADGGTFFLDELGEMSLQTQVRFLRLLETREFVCVGSSEISKVDVRFITATNRNLEQEVKNGNFREDLYYRINVIPVHIPPLRERKEDIPLLAGHFLARYAKRYKREVVGFAPEAIEFLQQQQWAGNIRELENTIQRAVTLGAGELINLTDLDLSQHDLGRKQMQTAEKETEGVEFSDSFDLHNALAKVEEKYICKALFASGGNMTRAAKLLGISFRQMRYKVKKLGLDS